jgi:uncharacterized membrane protein (UPF0127 family)
VEASVSRLPVTGIEAPRLRKLPRRLVFGVEVPSAETPAARLLGLALLSRAEAGLGLLIPGCRAIHTFGMRFSIDVLFLDENDLPLRVVRDLRPCRLVSDRRARSVLELPSLRDQVPDRVYDQEEDADVA